MDRVGRNESPDVSHHADADQVSTIHANVFWAAGAALPSSIAEDAMKAYLITTGAIFALLALVHLVHTIEGRSRLTTDAWFLWEGPGLGVVAAGISVWAWHLLRRLQRS
jgi:hypothetical protein